jgi:hypothetical protein
MAVEKDFDLLDDYLSNRLNESDKIDFEKKLEADPELKQEFKIQQDLTQGIRNARVAELKSMLNNVPVPPVSNPTSLLIKAGTWTLITGVVITGIYLYFNESESIEPVLEQAPIEEVPSVKSTPTEADSKEKEPVIAKATEEPTKKVETPVNEKPAPEVAAPSVAKKPDLKVYDPSKDEVDAAVQKYEKEQLEIISKAFVTSSIEVETENTHKKYAFHYMFGDGKLILYGAFEKHLYEILEFISDDKRTVVLFYRANYYLLDINKSAPTLLTPIKDKALLKKLGEYRGK